MDKLRLIVWRRSTTIILFVGVASILIGLVAAFAVNTFRPTTQVRVGSGVYSLWLANSEIGRVKGLSDIKKINLNEGLLMAFDSSDTHGIWMKDMNFPLDLVWLNSDKTVIYIVKNAPPENPAKTVYTPKDPALYLLELPAGSVEKAGIKTGDTANFELKV